MRLFMFSLTAFFFLSTAAFFIGSFLLPSLSRSKKSGFLPSRVVLLRPRPNPAPIVSIPFVGAMSPSLTFFLFLLSSIPRLLAVAQAMFSASFLLLPAFSSDFLTCLTMRSTFAPSATCSSPPILLLNSATSLAKRS